MKKIIVKNIDYNSIKIPQSVMDKILTFINNKPRGKFILASTMCNELKIPLAFLTAHVVCMGCGAITEKATYAIAQNAMGNKIVYTCGCGFQTNLPQ